MARDGVVLGTAGHVDHGKTTLVRALTGVDTDRWAEEKERGLTIDIGFARLDLQAELETGIVDVPGHEDFLKNMLAGTTGIDLLLLVISADEGPMPQTMEHLAIARLLGVQAGVVALTKVDRVDEEWLELAVETSREALATVGWEEWPIVPVSSVTGQGLDQLRAELAESLRHVAKRSPDDLFRLPVDRAFSIHGTGTVVTGTVWSGRVRTGDEVRILPSGQVARVRGLQVHEEPRREVEAGRRCALALVGPEAEEVPRGTVIVRGEAWRSSGRLGARIRILSGFPRPLRHDQRIRLYLGTREVMARLLLPDGRTLAPGETASAVIRLESPLVARVGDRFVLRHYSPVTTIGGGQVAELDPSPGWKRRAEGWSRILDGDEADTLTAAIEISGGAGTASQALPIVTGLDVATVESLEATPPVGVFRARDRWFPAASGHEARRFLLEELDRLHDSHRRSARVPLSALRASALLHFAEELVDRSLDELGADRELVVDGPGVRRPDHRARLSEAELNRKEELYVTIRAGDAEPPTRSELERRFGQDRDLLQDLLLLLREEGRIVAITPEIFLAREVTDQLVEQTRELLAGGADGPPTLFKEAFGVSRKYLIPILEYLDREGVTRRTGEGRVLVS